MISDVPLGVFLSGGIDSSAITALAARRSGQAIQTFSVGFEESEYDESGHARAVARSLGTKHVAIQLSQASFTSRLGDALGALDQPSFDAINTYFVSRAVREADRRAGRHRGRRALRRLHQLPSAASRASRGWPVSRRARCSISSAAATRAGYGAGGAPQGAGRSRHARDARRPARSLPARTGSSCRRLARARAGPRVSQTRSFPSRARATSTRRSRLAAARDLAARAASFTGERLLPDTDAASMAVSPRRVPLLDHRVRIAGGVDPVAAFRRSAALLLRDLALGSLDPTLFERPKQGFELPIGGWIRDELRGDVDATFADRGAAKPRPRKAPS
jgi:asparagine synthase (glutamine-hydrolysing)